MAYFAVFPLSVTVTDNVLPAAALFFFDFPHAETASMATSAATTTTSHLDPVFKFILLKGGWDGGRLAGACRYAHPVADREDRGHPVLVGDQLGVQGPGSLEAVGVPPRGSVRRQGHLTRHEQVVDHQQRALCELRHRELDVVAVLDLRGV